MSKVPLQDVRPGVILSADVHDRHGRFLLGQGVVLGEGHMRILRIWGVTDIAIEGGEARAKLEGDETFVSPEALRRAEEIVALCLGPVMDQDHVAVAELRKIFIQRTAREVAGSGSQKGAHEDFRDIPEEEPLDHRSMPPDKGRAAVRAFLDKDLELASLPTIFNRILSAINNPRSSAMHVAEVISQDPALSAKLLRIANSAFYGFPGRIESISRAVTIIGTRQLSILALGAAVIEKFQDVPDRLMDMEAFWRRSIACGIGARFLGSLKSLRNTESFFVSGLLHGLGQLVLFKYFPVPAGRALRLSQFGNILPAEAERRVFGFDHAWLGGEVMKRWKLPRRIEQSVRHQFAPIESDYPTETTVLHLAVILAQGLALGSRRALPVPPLDCQAWDQLRLTPGALATTLNHMASQVDAIYRLLFTVQGEKGEKR